MGGGTLRPLSCELSCLHRADGSALWKSGHANTSNNTTQVMAAVYGPVAPKLARHEQSTAVISVILKGNVNTATNNNSNNNNNYNSSMSDWEDLMKQWLTSAIVVQDYPRSVIQIVCHVIQADGSVLSAAFHAAVAALLDAGVAMNHVPVATTICYYPTSSTTTTHSTESSSSSSRVLLLDPTADEEMEGDATTWVIVTDPRQQALRFNNTTNHHHDNNVQLLGSCTIQSGSRCLSLEVLQQSVVLALKASPAVQAFWRLAVEQKCHREAQTLFGHT